MAIRAGRMRRSRGWRAADFHGVVIPGGFMPDKLRRDDKVKQLVREFAESGQTGRGDLPRRVDSDLGGRLSRSASDRFAGIKDDLVNAGAIWEDCAGSRRSPLRIEPQAG